MSVLDDMTKGIMQTKADKATKLTPVKGESTTTVAQLAAATVPEVPAVFLTAEAVADIAKDLRRQAAVLIEVADGLDAYNPTDGLVARPNEAVVEAKLAEKEGDRKAADRELAAAGDKRAIKRVEKADAGFAADFAAKQAEAQASVYAAADDGATEEPAAPEAPASGWVCPEHGAKHTVTMPPSRKGRIYNGCNFDGCKLFEK